MNSVNYILLFLLFLSVHAGAQEFRYGSGFGSSTNSYSISLPVNAEPWLTPNDGITAAPALGTKATSVFVEFGDGSFSFLPNGQHDFMQTNNLINVTTKATGVYGGGGKPPSYRISASIGNGSVPFTPMSIFQNLTDRLAITPNIGSVLANDTMIFVLTYKNILPGGSLLFLFNDNSSTPVFKNVFYGQTITDPLTPHTTKFLRTYGSESEIPEAQVSTVRSQYSQYSNSLAINNLEVDGKEHNIFITLIPNDGLLSTKISETMLKAVMFWGKSEEKTEKAEKEITLPVGDLAHDPNYITVKPNCMLLPKAGKQLQYRVHFQNTGIGPASLVRVAVKIPENVNMLTDITYASSFYMVPNGTLNAAFPYSNNNVIHDSLVFVFNPNGSTPGCTLDGMGSTATNLSNHTTMGDFWFTINANDQMPNMLLAQASIVFYNSNNTPNDPILTNTAVAQFRDCCECEKNCDPCKKRKGLWKWLFCKKC